MAQLADLDRRLKALENPKLQLGSALSGARWQADDVSIRAYDGTATNYGAPSGAGVTTEVTAAGLLFAAKLLLQTALSGARIVLDSSVPVIKVVDPNGVTRVEAGNLAGAGVSAAGWKIRANRTDGLPLFDSDGLIGTANLLATDDVGSQTGAGSGTGWSTVQTITSSGANFTLSRQGNLMVVSTLSVVLTAGAQNYCALYHGIWQGGTLITRKRIPAAGFTLNVNYFVTGVSIFIGIPAGSYTLKQEFALDVGTTAVGFGTGATGIAPLAEVIQLGG